MGKIGKKTFCSQPEIQVYPFLGCGFKYFLFSSLSGETLQMRWNHQPFFFRDFPMVPPPTSFWGRGLTCQLAREATTASSAAITDEAQQRGKYIICWNVRLMEVEGWGHYFLEIWEIYFKNLPNHNLTFNNKMSSEWFSIPTCSTNSGSWRSCPPKIFRPSPSNDQQHLPMEQTLSRPYSKATSTVTKTMFMQFI